MKITSLAQKNSIAPSPSYSMTKCCGEEKVTEIATHFFNKESKKCSFKTRKMNWIDAAEVINQFLKRWVELLTQLIEVIERIKSGGDLFLEINEALKIIRKLKILRIKAIITAKIALPFIMKMSQKI